MISKIHILSIPIANVSRTEACQWVFQQLEKGKSAMIATANAEMVMQAQQNEVLATILQHADLVVPDGAGVLWAAEQQGKQFKERVTGVDLACMLLAEAAARQTPVYLLGSAEGIARQVASNVENKFGAAFVVGTHSGFFTSAEEKKIIEEIKWKKAKLVFVALGVPKQEIWIQEHLSQLENCVCMGVGGTFDVLAGKAKRAPHWMQQNRLEWLYRLYKEPTRFKRMLSLPNFVIAVKKQQRNK